MGAGLHPNDVSYGFAKEFEFEVRTAIPMKFERRQFHFVWW
jgi:hypothetical protein